MAKLTAESILESFNQLNSGTIDSVDKIYAVEVKFIDPLHEINGLIELKRYLAYQYKNVKSCQFHLEDSFQKEQSLVLFWRMDFRHKLLRFGNGISVEGSSHLRLTPDLSKIVYHRDYFDLSAFLYENLPVVGPLVRRGRELLAQVPMS